MRSGPDLFPGTRAEPARRNWTFPLVSTALIIFLIFLQFVPNFAYQLNYAVSNTLGLQPMNFAGPAGAQGVSGTPGSAGSAGNPGVDGLSGSLGPGGPAGPAGADGAAGAVGAAGAAGADGADGADGSGGVDNGAGVVSLGACDARVEIRMTSSFDIATKIFYVDTIVISDIADACQGQSLDIWIYGAADTELAEALGLTIPNATTMTVNSSDLTPSAVVAADPTNANEEAASVVFAIQ